MQKSLLSLYLQKVSQGDQSYAERLCHQLADRLVFVPVIDSESERPESEGANVTLQVYRNMEAHRSLVPIFTSEKKFRDWSEKQRFSGRSISLLGGDFCAALGKDTWLVVDSLSEASVELQPVLVARIAESGMTDQVSEQLPAQAVTQSVVQTNVLSKVALEKARSDIMEKTAPKLDPAAEIPTAEIAQPRVTPITQEHEIPTREIPMRTLSSAALARPVIFSSSEKMSELEEKAQVKKKKSFLSFLKGS